MTRSSVCVFILFVLALQKAKTQLIRISDDEWGDWSPCSRSCGVGVMYQNRRCPDVTDNGSCPEKKRQYRTCNIQDCPEGSVDFRFEQCAKFNNRSLDGEKYKWVPYIPEHDVCGLNCMPKGKYFYYTWAPKVVDGTKCGPELYDICVNGKCQPLGCDLIMHSKAKEDKCRVCNGNGENCRTITGEYKDSGTDYKEFLIIPRSATNIMITEANIFGHYLALSDENGGYFFNGNYEITNPRTFKIGGALFRYERTGLGQETIRSLGPTTEPIHAVVLMREEFDNPDIKYEFSVPKHIKVLPKVSEYKWETGEYGSCSASCAGGYQFRKVRCVRVRDQNKVNQNGCESSERPSRRRRCNTKSCPPRWFIGGFGPCSVTCGRGKQVRRIHCEHVVEGGEPQMITDDNCSSPKPISMRTCMLDMYCPTWNSARWSQCSTSCGEGNSYRSVRCQDASGQTLPESSCDPSSKPKTTARCNPGPCTVKWIATNWSPCYPKCGEGISTRMVYCVSINDEDQKYPRSLCNDRTRPASRKACVNRGSCTAMWHGSQWSRCTASCGIGMQMRNVMCAVQEGRILRILDNERCNASYVMPKVRKCSDRPCLAGWYIHQWKPCSKSCGYGIKRRDVTCMADSKIVPDARWCDKSEKPVEFESCWIQDCTDRGGTTRPVKTRITTETPTKTLQTAKLPTQGKPTTIHETTTRNPITTPQPTTESPTTTQETTTRKLTTTQPTTTEKHTTKQETTTSKPTTTRQTATETPTSAQETSTLERTTTQPPTETPTATQETTESTTAPAPLRRTLTQTEGPTATEITTRTIIIRKPSTPKPVPVSIVQQPNDVVRYVDSEVLMRCRATGSPPPKITWRKGMMPISAMGERFKILEDGTLQIYKVRSEDEGIYTCFASNFVTPLVNASCKLTVIVPVFVTVYPSSTVKASVNDRIVLECTPLGKPSPRVNWYKDGEIIFSGSNQTSYKLTINKASLSDVGRYECRGDNGYGSDSKTVRVEVKDKGFTSVASPTTQEVCADRKDLYCKIVKTLKELCNNGFYKRACCKSCTKTVPTHRVIP